MIELLLAVLAESLLELCNGARPLSGKLLAALVQFRAKMAKDLQATRTIFSSLVLCER